MNGAESLVRTLLDAGIETCFANPGTSEMHFVAALDRVEGLRCVLCLAETVVTGSADGYARMAGKPAVTLLHCGPGLANGVTSLHNARRADAQNVNILGDQAHHPRQGEETRTEIAGYVDMLSPPRPAGGGGGGGGGGPGSVLPPPQPSPALHAREGGRKVHRLK